MNPPFGKKSFLPLNILSLIVHCVVDRNKGVVISLQSAAWLQDPMVFLKKGNNLKTYSLFLDKRLHEVKIIPTFIANQQFDCKIGSDLAIYKLAPDGYYLKDFCLPVPDILKKVIKLPSLYKQARAPQEGDFTVVVPYIHGNLGRHDFYDVIRVKFEKSNKARGAHSLMFKFKTEQEARNFHASLRTTFIRYIHSLMKTDQRVRQEVIPWMGDYKEEWTDERYFAYFKIDKQEQQTIEQRMKSLYSNLKF
jgi:hypothetical protein